MAALADFFTGGTDPGTTSASSAPVPADREGMRALERSGALKYFKEQHYAGRRAGMPTESLVRSQTALDYASARLEGGRTFLMDDYAAIGRTSRRPAPTADSVASLIGYQAAPEPFSQGDGLSSTKFATGFTRRQQRDIQQDGARRAFEEERSHRLLKPAQMRSQRLSDWQSFSYSGYNLITGQEISGEPTPRHLKTPLIPDKRHVFPEVAGYRVGAGGDGPIGRLRDSTSRFFCTPDELKVSEARQRNLINDGLVTTKRKSTILGFGDHGARLESIGVRENFNESHYAQERRARFERVAAAKATDVALVQALS